MAEQTEAADGMEAARTRFEQWRSSRSRKSPIPDELWKLAIDAARQQGVNRAAQQLPSLPARSGRRRDRWGPRVLCIGDPTSGTTESPYNRLNASAFAVPAVGSIGLGCSRNLLYGPGVNNWDMSLQKTLRFKERALLLLRGEAFNVFNHTQFSGVRSSLTFSSLTDPKPTNLPYNSSGQLVNITGFGTINNSRSACAATSVLRHK